MQLIDFWLPCLAAVETQFRENEKRIGWLREPSDRWLRALDIVAASLIIGIVKLHMRMANFISAQMPREAFGGIGKQSWSKDPSPRLDLNCQLRSHGQSVQKSCGSDPAVVSQE